MTITIGHHLNLTVAAENFSLPLDGGGPGWGWCMIARFQDTPLPNPPPPRRRRAFGSTRGSEFRQRLCFGAMAARLEQAP